MTLWLILTIMTAAAAVWLTVPLVRRFDRPRDDAAGAVEVYRDQLEEVERELREGAIDDTQAETARVEIKRRILTADRSRQATAPTLAPYERNFAVIGATGIVVLGSVALYAVTGRPDLAAPASAPSPRADVLTSPPPGHPLGGLAAADEVPSSNEGAPPQGGLPSVAEMTQRLASRLAQQPNDINGWRTLGWSYLNLGQFSEAAAAYAKAIKLDPSSTELRSGQIEALVGLATGTVTAEAKAAIAEALKLDPRNARVRFFEGLAKQQDGDEAAALAEWTDVLKDADPEESWVADLKTRVKELRPNMGAQGDAVSGQSDAAIAGLPRQGPATGVTPSTTKTGPTAEDVRAAQTMSPADRSAMIHAMVDRLASRLERSPRDADGWIKLIRARIVLGESDLAKQTLARGLEVFADDATERDRIAASARQLGLAP